LGQGVSLARRMLGIGRNLRLSEAQVFVRARVFGEAPEIEEVFRLQVSSAPRELPKGLHQPGYAALGEPTLADIGGDLLEDRDELAGESKVVEVAGMLGAGELVGDALFGDSHAAERLDTPWGGVGRGVVGDFGEF